MSFLTVSAIVFSRLTSCFTFDSGGEVPMNEPQRSWREYTCHRPHPMKIRLYVGESDGKHVRQVFKGGVPGNILRFVYHI